MRTNSQQNLPSSLPLDFIAGMERHGLTLKDLRMAEVVEIHPVPKSVTRLTDSFSANCHPEVCYD
ncbi:MAG: hypothetical protein ACYCZR_02115 [Burkholderiales bacterium]|jgi:hypothetical protein